MFDETTGETIRLVTTDGGATVTDEEGNPVDEWYNYEEKKWANAVTVDADDNITGYYVWIPRYAYAVNSGYHTSTIGIKKILFLQGTTNKDKNDFYHSTLYESVGYMGDRQLEYLVHPAFSFGGNISGFWMAKFETSQSEDGKVRVLPDVLPWKKIKIGEAFDAAIAAKDEDSLAGKSGDTHLVKNVEWGAMAYLASSKYGKESDEVWINNYSKYRTGMGSAVSKDAGGTADLSLLVDYKTPVQRAIQQSTTGNIYGIYDISGGVTEFVSGFINTTDQFNNVIDQETKSKIDENGASLFTADYKYKDLYQRTIDNQGKENYNLSSNKKGDAVWETSSVWFSESKTLSWFGDYSYMPNTRFPFFVRGGHYNYRNGAGIFSFMCTNGKDAANTGFRIAIARSL